MIKMKIKYWIKDLIRTWRIKRYVRKHYGKDKDNWPFYGNVPPELVTRSDEQFNDVVKYGRDILNLPKYQPNPENLALLMSELLKEYDLKGNKHE